MKVVMIVLCVFQLFAKEYWTKVYSAFTSDNIVDNEGWTVQGNYGVLTSFCNGKSLFGGFNLFGAGTSISKLIPLVPHYKVRVILEFWKIDSWDMEYAYIFLDDIAITDYWNIQHQYILCGNPDYVDLWKDDNKLYIAEFFHTEPTLLALITTNLNGSPYTESWGFRNFTVEIGQCASGCQMCYDDTPNECWYYGLFERNWFDNFNFDGWTLDNQVFHGKSQCLTIWIAGGIGQITGQSEHYKILLHFQLWKFDIWNNNQFSIEIDGQVGGLVVLNQFEFGNLCGDSNGGEKLINFRLARNHIADSVKITMMSNLMSSSGAWGIRAFSLYIVKCYITCLICSGPNKNDCSMCKIGYILHNSECVDVKWITGLKQYFQSSDFQIQSGWTFSNVIQNNQQPFQICNGINLLGGYSLFGKDASASLTFDLPKHTKIRIKLEFWKFDSWDQEWFKVFANGILVYQVQFWQTGVQIVCGTNYPEAYIKNLDFEFDHSLPTINLVMTSSLDEPGDNESWAIRGFQLLYGVPKDCSNSIIDSVTLPSFIGTSYLQSTWYSSDQTLQNNINIQELGISLQPNFDQTINIDSAMKKLTISIIWSCFLKDQTFSISILQSSYPDYKTGMAACKYKRSNVIRSVLAIERTIMQQSEIRLLATSTSFEMSQIVEGQTIKQYEMIIN